MVGKLEVHFSFLDHYLPGIPGGTMQSRPIPSVTPLENKLRRRVYMTTPELDAIRCLNFSFRFCATNEDWFLQE
jgi:hypothetical protein